MVYIIKIANLQEINIISCKISEKLILYSAEHPLEFQWKLLDHLGEGTQTFNFDLSLTNPSSCISIISISSSRKGKYSICLGYTNLDNTIIQKKYITLLFL